MLTRRAALAALPCAALFRPFAGLASALGIPARRDRSSRILIDVRLNGSRPLTCLLDTGGGAQAYISRTLAAALGIEVTGAGRSGGANDRVLQPDGRARVALQVGSVTLRDQPLVIQDRPFPYAGVIGAKLFASAVIELDYQAPAVRFHPRADFLYQGSGRALPFELWQNNPQIVVTLTLRPGDEIPARMTVDTGADGADAWLTRGFDDRLRRLDRVLLWQPERGGPESCRIVRLAAGPFAVENAQLRRLPVRGGFGGHPDAPDGLLAAGFLSRYRIFLDYGARQMILEPYAAPAERA